MLLRCLITLLAFLSATVSAGAQTITVDGTAPPNRVNVVAATTVSLSISGGPGNPADWVALYPVGAADGDYLRYYYLSGTDWPPEIGVTSATFPTYAPLVAGEYEWRMFADNGWTRIATSSLVTVTTSPAVLRVNGEVPPTPITLVSGSQGVVSLESGTGHGGDSIGLYRVGEPDTLVDWRYFNDTGVAPGVTTATLYYTVPSTVGTYEFRFLAEGGGVLTKTTVTVAQSTATMSVNGVTPPTSVTVAPGSALALHLAGGPGNALDWVALAAQGAPDSEYSDWQYLNGSGDAPGVTSATLSFTAPSTLGSYELRLFANNGYERLATSSPIVVGSTESPNVTVAMTSPFHGTTFNAPSSLLLAASASITGATITRVDFFIGSTLIGSASATPYETTWSSPSMGEHVLTAAVVDSTTGVTTSTPVSVTIASSSSGAGTLGAPIADPPAGIYSAAQTVTLRAAPGATIRYTVDGTDPDETSAPYSEPLAVSQSGALRARAYQPGWTASEIEIATYVIDTTAPTITATVSPSANAAGWHNSTVTVTFTCADNLSVSTCPASATVSSDGTAQLVTGSAIDSAGNSTPISVSINLDRTAPSVEIPAELPAAVASAALSFDAAISDSSSGLSGTTCNGVTAQTVGNPVTCSLTLNKGRNVIVVAAMDIAGNVGSDSAIVTLTPTAEATSISVSPVSAGMIVGEERTFSVRDDQDRMLIATWETSDPEVIDFVEGRATAFAPGEVTLTATANGLTATTSVVVYAGPFMPAGAHRWSNPSVGGASGAADTVFLNASEGDSPSLLSIEYTNPDRTNPLVRGLTVDGTELWTSTLPIGPQEWLDSPLADPYGGMVALVRDLSTFQVRGIIRAGWSDGLTSWRRDLPEGFDASIMQASDGTLYVSEGSIEFNEFDEEVPTIYTVRHDIVGMDTNSGAVRFRMRLPSFTIYQQRNGKNFQDVYVLPALDGRALSSDNSLYLTTTTGFSTDAYPQTWARDSKLLRIDPTGDVTFEQLFQGEKSGTAFVPYQLRMGNMHADGAGGVFFQRSNWSGSGSPTITGLYRSATFSNSFEMEADDVVYWADVTSIDSKLITASSIGPQDTRKLFDMRTGAVQWEIPSGGPTEENETAPMERATVALAGGGAILVDGLGGYRTINSLGATESTANLGIGVGAYAFGRFHARDSEGTLHAVPWEPVNDVTSHSSVLGFGSQPVASAFGVFLKSHIVVEINERPLHAALRLVPRNQKDWLSTNHAYSNYFSAKPKYYGDLHYATLGAGPNSVVPCSGTLVSGINRERDFSVFPVHHARIQVPEPNEDTTMLVLLNATNDFQDGVVPYACYPESNDEYYNSNSFLHGLLNKAGLSAPPTLNFNGPPPFPGWSKPVPSSYYSPPQ